MTKDQGQNILRLVGCGRCGRFGSQAHGGFGGAGASVSAGGGIVAVAIVDDDIRSVRQADNHDDREKDNRKSAQPEQSTAKDGERG